MADTVKATQSISKAQYFRDETKIVMQPFANWEEYLVPAPVSIAILGKLVCISSNVDFSINKKPSKDGFKYIKYPDSFHACLIQVANSMSAAFSEAHKNVEQIRLHTGYMTAYIKVSMKLFVQDNEELIGALLPDHKEIITAIPPKCVELADQSEKKFTSVLYLIQDLLEACVTAKKVYGDDLEKAECKTEAKEIDFNTSIKVLLRGLDAMSRVKEQWEKMVRVFQMISSIVKNCLTTVLTSFFKTAERASQRNLPYDTKKFLKDVMYQNALATSNVASLVSMISETYVEVSDKHLRDRVSSLGELIALGPSRPSFETECRKLQDACDAVQEAIRDAVKKNINDFQEQTKERMEKIERELQPMLPPVSEEIK